MTEARMTLEERVAALEAVEAIRRLKARYAWAADEKYTPDHQRRPQEELDRFALIQAECFTQDAIWDGGAAAGPAVGREAIFQTLRSGPWKMSMHYFLMPHITVDGDRAEGRWYLWQTATMVEKDTPIFMSGMTNDDYIRLDGEWLIGRMRLTVKFITPFHQPWTVNRNDPLVV
jgi:hypothetical protein